MCLHANCGVFSFFLAPVKQRVLKYRLGTLGMSRTLDKHTVAEAASQSKDNCGSYSSFSHARFVLGHPVHTQITVVSGDRTKTTNKNKNGKAWGSRVL